MTTMRVTHMYMCALTHVFKSQCQHFSSRSKLLKNTHRLPLISCSSQNQLGIKRGQTACFSQSSNMRAAGSKDVPVEQTYRRLSAVDHVLLRPGMYIGSNEQVKDTQWIYNGKQMVQKEVTWLPGLLTVFDEILMNAADNGSREGTNLSKIEVTIEKGAVKKAISPSISVTNYGRGIPVRMHADENMYIPELVFGHLMTGSNFSDDTEQVTGGKHGFGAKLTNIFSKRFRVETVDTQANARFSQTWTNNMSTTDGATVSKTNADDVDYTKVTFQPDLRPLGMLSESDTDVLALSDDDYNTLCTRVVDLAGTLRGDVQLTLNGENINIGSFENYVKLYKNFATKFVYGESGTRWEYAVGPSPRHTFQSLSFVNNVRTRRGGTHVSHVTKQLVQGIHERILKQKPKSTVTTSTVRSHLSICINSFIENAKFDSQVKDMLTTKPSEFGSECEISNEIFETLIAKTNIVNRILESERKKEATRLRSQVRNIGGNTSIMSIPKLEDAVHAAKARSHKCTLILTEGDSAKALAVAGFEVVGRDYYGVFPLRGKLLNVRDAGMRQLSENAEITTLCKILGLKFDKVYSDDPNDNLPLRYGKVLIMTDQDHDGAHIKGLLLNFFAFFWPELVRRGDFLGEFRTPLIKASYRGKDIRFYNTQEYDAWHATIPAAEQRKWQLKYYKGLGTSSSTEAKLYFSSLDKHVTMFSSATTHDCEALDMVFSKHRAIDRRDWLATRPPSLVDETSNVANETSNVAMVSQSAAAMTIGGSTTTTTTTTTTTPPITTTTTPPTTHTATPTSDTTTSTKGDGKLDIQTFVYSDLIHYAHADNTRSLPSAIDGLKPSQRKVLYACFKRNLTKEIKVAQLSGYVAEHSAYHHGEASLHSTIVGMAQDFPGSNNLPYLQSSGQFGTRHHGGKDAASPRYIFTFLSKYARLLFPQEDDCLLLRNVDDGMDVEPKNYVPVIPTLLVNGAHGIGTGWSTNVPPFHPLELIANVRHMINNTPCDEILPWTRGFSGVLRPKADNDAGFDIEGKIERLSEAEYQISELPLGKWTSDYKNTLNELVEKDVVQSYKEFHTEKEIRFDVTLCSPETLDKMSHQRLLKLFKLTTTTSTTNMHAFDNHGFIKKYEKVQEILTDFFPIRAALYVDRKEMLESKLLQETQLLENRYRFIHAIINNEMQLTQGKFSNNEMDRVLSDAGYQQMSASKTHTDDTSYNYLLELPLNSFTTDKLQRLETDLSSTNLRLSTLQQTTPMDLWRLDLEKLETAIISDFNSL